MNIVFFKYFFFLCAFIHFCLISDFFVANCFYIYVTGIQEGHHERNHGLLKNIKT